MVSTRLTWRSQKKQLSTKDKRKKVVEVANICFRYQNIEASNVINNASFDIYENEFVCIIGSNGSGKSTLSKIIGGILKPQKGTVRIDGILINHDNLPRIRQKIGIIFQNPENQFIGTTVYDDIAFGLQNYNVPVEDQPKIIQSVAKRLKISDLLNKEPHELSGGQKQKVAVASVFVLRPDIIIFDESTSMLDAEGKAQITELMYLLKNKYNKTIISVTHCMDDTVNADRVLVIHQGNQKFFLPPKQLFLNHYRALTQLSLDVPIALKISSVISDIQNTIILSDCIKQFNKKYQLQDPKNWCKFILSKDHLEKFRSNNDVRKSTIVRRNQLNEEDIIRIKNYSLTYNTKSRSCVRALSNLSCSFHRNQINVIIGTAGAGKSTLFQIVDFLIRGQSGKINVNIDPDTRFQLTSHKYPKLNNKICRTNNFRKYIGFIFQFPEYQLFNQTVLKEVSFSYYNFHRPSHSSFFSMMFSLCANLMKHRKLFSTRKDSPKMISKAEKLLKLVQINKKYLKHNPLELSGGQKRKVAIASVLAYSPWIIMFDEPTAGLDPASAANILRVIRDLQSKARKTILLITHNMDLALEVGDNLTYMRNGRVYDYGGCYKMFKDHKFLKKNKIATPQIIKILSDLRLQQILDSQNIQILTIAHLRRFFRLIF